MRTRSNVECIRSAPMEPIRRLVAGTVIAIVALAVLVAGCSSTAQAPAPAQTPTRTLACRDAPAALIKAINEGMTTKGAKLTKAVVGPATDLSGPPIVESDKFAHASWVIGYIEGAPDRPLGIWLVKDLADPGLIFAANAGSRKHSELGADVKDLIGGHGTEIRDCVS